MARAKPIRIRKIDRQEYARLVKNTKAKIRRVQKNYGIDLSGEIKIPPLESFKTRQEFNEWKEQMQSFTNRSNLRYQFKKNQYGVVASKALLNEIERNVKTAQELARKEIKRLEKMPFIQGGKVQGTAGERIRMLRRPNVGGLNVIPDFNFENVKTYQDLFRIQERAKTRANPEYFDWRQQIMKQNFIDLIRINAGAGWDDLIQKLESLSPEQFYEIYMMYDVFDFALWDSEGNMSGDEVNHLAEAYDAILTRFQNGKLNTDLWGF